VHRAIGIAPVAVALLIAACGSSKSNTSSSSSTPSSSSSAGATTTAASAASTAPAIVISTKSSKGLGTILDVGPKHLTVYMFGADKGSASSCTGKCAAAWPPVIGNPHAGGTAVSADLGTIKRTDGKTQVTYKGHPLYTFAKDEDEGDAYGQKNVAFGAAWHVLTPAGSMVEASASAS
jgi:predicted lipoprotein with Yx(FWY)xxD motif